MGAVGPHGDGALKTARGHYANKIVFLYAAVVAPAKQFGGG
jgi:hypothetical protein